MNNGFSDFFETLLPREIALYILPGSVFLAASVWVTRMKDYSLRPNQLYKAYISLRGDQVGTADYILYGVVLLAAAYIVGLLIAAVKHGWYKIVGSCIFRLARNSKSVRKVLVRLQSSLIIISYENSSKNKRDVDTLGSKAMYLSIREEVMYRREIERYGVFKEALENLLVCLFFVGLFIAITGKQPKALLLGLAIPFGSLILIYPGINGYRQLQRFRISTLYDALSAKESLENR